MQSLGIYIQVPFCQTRCTYCNFHTGVVSSGRFAPYVEAVAREISGYRALYKSAGVSLLPESGPGLVDTVYIGGGTPSLLDPALLSGMLLAIRATFPCKWREVTLEADPETVTRDKANAWASAGINRISFGVQSFIDAELLAAGRMHRRDDVYRAESILQNAGITNISFDLIAGLPHQTDKSWSQSLAELVALSPEHVSVYLLEVDEGSRLGKEVLSGGTRYSRAALPSEDEMAEFYESAITALASVGYHHYEISNWAKPGFESAHNLKYWRREPYLGFGAGAHSFSGSQRWANAHDAAVYVQSISAANRLPIEQLEAVTEAQALDEELFLGLRQLEGINLKKIERDYGVELGGKIVPLERAGLIEREGDTIRLAPGKLSISNEAFIHLLG
jgi:putative oxygen-independent coproporphyrinogen III oxidase